jgi:leucyl aminopeptidase
LFEIKRGDIRVFAPELLVIPVTEERALFEEETLDLLIASAKEFKEFQGRKGDQLLLYRPKGVKATRVLFQGVGKAAELDGETLRKAAGKAVKKAHGLELEAIMMVLLKERDFAPDGGFLTQALLEGAFLANHRFDHYKKSPSGRPLSTIRLFPADNDPALEMRVARVETICRSTLIARDWVNMPPNEKRPHRFARSIAKAADKEELTVTVLDEAEIKKNHMGGIIAVGAGSRARARMVILEYKPEHFEKTHVLVGKGVTYDSGGINIKPGTGLEDMKMDMAGAAAVAASLIAVSRLAPPVRVVGVMPVVENMLSGDAARPGDIIRSYSGKTVEIGNTDAEGRLILMDAMGYAQKLFSPDAMIDVATLTGACKMALGEKIAGVFTLDDGLKEAVISAGEKVHERCWPMPMPEDYRELLKSDHADIRNVGTSRWGGAIAAALFLSEFVQIERWAHIDIAGPAWAGKSSDYCGPGATGFGVRLLMEIMEQL